MNTLIVLLSILFVSGIGFLLLRLFGILKSKDNLIALGASYGLGVGLIALQLYLYYRIDIPWQREYVLAPWVILLGIMILKNIPSRKRLASIKEKIKKFNFPKISKIDKINFLLIIGILIAVSYTIFEALLRPVVTWDAWSVWLLYPKMFFIDGKVTVETLRYTFAGYPPTVSLLDSFIYISLGKIDDTAVLLTSSAFYIFLAITFFAVLKQKFGLRYALLFTFLMVTTQNFIRHGGRLEAGLADLPVGYFAFLSVIFLFEYFKTHAPKILLICSVFLGITSLIKYEGLPLAFFIAFCCFIYIIRNRLFKHLLILVLWIAPFFLWQTDRRITGIANTYFSEGHSLEYGIMKSKNAFSGTFKELINIKSWGLLWITYFYSLIAFGIKKQKELAVLNFVILSQLILYLVIYNVTAGNAPDSSIQRLLMHIAPLAYLCIAIVFKIIFKNKKFIS